MNMPPPPNMYQPQIQKPQNDYTKLIIGGICGCLCVVLSAVGIIAAFFFSSLDKGRSLAGRAGCMQIASKLGNVMQMYMADNDDTLPIPNKWMTCLSESSSVFSASRPNQPGTGEDRFGLLRCPEIGRHGDPKAFGFAFSDSVSGSISGIPDGFSTPLIFDSTMMQWDACGPISTLPNPPRHGKNTILYADLHAGSVSNPNGSPEELDIDINNLKP